MNVQKLTSSLRNGKKFAIDVAINNQTSRKSDIKDARKINLLLNEDKWKDALPDLLVLVRQCDENLLLSEGCRWFKLCSQVFSKKVDEIVIIHAALLLHYLLLKCRKYAKLQVEISKLSSAFIADICRGRASIPRQAFNLIYDYMVLFSSQAMAHRGIVEQTVLRYLTRIDCEDKDCNAEIVSAAKVFSVLPCHGTYMSEQRTGAKGDQLMQLIYLSHEAMDILFKVVVEIESYNIQRTCNLKISNKNILGKNENDFESYISALTVFRNSHTYIPLFLNHTDSNMELNPKTIISIFMRPLEVYAIEKRNDLDYDIFRSYLHIIHQTALITMKKMLQLQSQKQITDRYHQDMLKCVEHILSSENESRHLPAKTKELAYDALAAICMVSVDSLFLPVSLCNLIIRDITPKKTFVTINNNDKASKKGKSHYETTVQYQVEYYGNVVKAALNLATEIYACHIVNISKLFAQKLNTCLVFLLTNLNEGPYLEHEVRNVFYTTLKANTRRPGNNLNVSYQNRMILLKNRKKLENIENARLIHEIMQDISFICSTSQHVQPSVNNSISDNTEDEEQNLPLENEESVVVEDKPDGEICEHSNEKEEVDSTEKLEIDEIMIDLSDTNDSGQDVQLFPHNSISGLAEDDGQSSSSENEESVFVVEEPDVEICEDSSDKEEIDSTEVVEVGLLSTMDQEPVSEEVEKIVKSFVPTFN